MDKKLVKNILAVVLGIALIAMIFAVFSLIVDAIGTSDLESLDAANKALGLFKWQAVALVCILVPTLACYAFAYFGNGKIFNIASAVLSLFVAVTAISFTFVLREAALDEVSSITYASVTAAFSEFIQLAACALIACVYFILNSVFSFKKTKTEVAENCEEANGNEEN